MAKAVSPIRLQENLMRAAESTAKRFHRSTAEQIEYWADLGKTVASSLDPDILLSVSAGLSILKAEPVFSAPVDPDVVFQSLENEREEGVLQNTISTNSVKYQASTQYLGYLEQIDLNGTITTGQFDNGQFTVFNGVGL